MAALNQIHDKYEFDFFLRVSTLSVTISENITRTPAKNESPQMILSTLTTVEDMITWIPDAETLTFNANP